MTECGCKIERKSFGGSALLAPIDPCIVYCPLHASAVQMQEALELMTSMVVLTPETAAPIQRARRILTAATGGTR